MASFVSPPALQMSWLDQGVVAWQPGRGVQGGNLHHDVANVARLPRGGAGFTRVVPIELPTGTASFMVQLVDSSTLVALADSVQAHGLAPDTSASVAWFAAIYGVAAGLVSRGRVMPSLAHHHGSVWHATWQPLSSDLEHVEPLLRAMPPVVRAVDHVDAEHILRTVVDSLTRITLLGSRHQPSLGDNRSASGRAARLVVRALTEPDHTLVITDELLETAARVSHEFHALTRRADGEPILRGRLRLAMPSNNSTPTPQEERHIPDHFDELDEASADSTTRTRGAQWPLQYEIVDIDDRSRWCTGNDILQGTPSADEVAGDPRFRPILRQQMARDLEAVAVAVPELAEWATARLDGSTSLTGIAVDTAASILESIDALAVAGLELVAPERLVRKKPTARAVVQALPSSDQVAGGRLATGALVAWQPMVDDTPISEDQLAKAALQGATLIQAGGRWVQVDRAEARRALANIESRRDQVVSPLELLRMAAELEAELERASTGIAGVDDVPAPTDQDAFAHGLISADGWAAELLAGLPDSGLHEGVVPDRFTATLRPYQRRGLGWLQFLRTLGLGGCLADDMGLGKTPTTLAHLAGQPGPHMVVCPLSVVRNWEAEAARFVPTMRTMVHHGTGRRDTGEFVRDATAHELIITTYQIAARDLDAMQQVRWSTIVLDEAQAVKNPDTATSRAMRSIFAEQHVALTGTPIENRLSELWSIFNIVTPGLLGNATQFRKQFALPIERHHDAVATSSLRTLTAPFLLRRTKADKSLVPDLPDKIEQVAWATLTREQVQMYQAVVDQLLKGAATTSGMQRRGIVLAALTRLKQICNHPAHALGDGSKLAGRSGKLQRFDELVTDLLDAGEQALVFTQFREMGELLQQHLHERFHQSVPFLHGGVPKSGRDRMVEQFQDGNAPSPLLLVSLRAGGTGLNLTAASRVVHYDRWWNPAVEDQATDRAWRIGQQRSVFVHKLVCQGTVEERIDALINDKRQLAEAVVGAGSEAWMSELSTDELRDFVVLDTKALEHRPTHDGGAA